MGDGILMGLLLLEIMGKKQQPLRAIVQDLLGDLGPFYYGREDLRTAPFSKVEMVQRLLQDAPQGIAGLSVASINALDGVKYVFAENEGWLLIRPSGTEPVLRVYAEARSHEIVAELLKQGAFLAEARQSH
jgi:phosphomannomutase